MFLPLGDEPNPQGVPWVTYGLIATNVAVYLAVSLPLSVVPPDLGDPALVQYVAILVDQFAGRLSEAELLGQVSAYDLVVFNYGFRPAAPDPVALFTAMFLHAGFMHLAGNMLFLWIYGDNVEHRLGSGRFLLAYLVTGVAATLFHTAFDAGSALPLVGASGAISGVLGFYFIWFPHNRVRLWIVLFPFFMRVVHWPARLVLGGYLFLDNVMPFLITRGVEGGGVAYGAHIGGFLGGLAWAWWAGHKEVAGRPDEYRRAERTGAVSPAAAVAALASQGRFQDAAPAYFRLTTEKSRRLLTPDDSIAFADWLVGNGHPEAALAVYQRHLRDYPIGPLAAEAHLGAGLVQLNALGQPTAAYQHLVEVFDLDPEPDTAAKARHGLAEISGRQKFRVRGG
jgi:membrane associated rhomboid family serine protease